MAHGYTSEELLAMQKDAIRRVNEMRRLSEEKLRQSGAAPVMNTPPPSEPQKKAPEKETANKSVPRETAALAETAAPSRSVVGQSGGLSALLQKLGGDRETMLLLALLFLLIKEEADVSLILALVYILL